MAAEADQPSHEPDLRAAAGSWAAVPALAQGAPSEMSEECPRDPGGFEQR